VHFFIQINGAHTFDITRWHITIAIVLFHASFIYLWYGCNNVTYCSYDTYNMCVPYNTYGPHHQMGAIVFMGHVGHMDMWHFLCIWCVWDMCYVRGWEMWNNCCRCCVWDICYTCPLFTSGSHMNGPSKWI